MILAARLRSGGLMQQGALVFASSMLLAACGFAFHAVASRALGVAGYGALYALISSATLISVPAAILGPVIVRFSAEFRALHDDQHLRSLAIGVASFAAIFGGAVIIVTIVAAKPIAGFLHVAPLLVPFVGLLTAGGFASGALRSFVQGMQWYGAYAISCALEGLVKVGGIAVVVALAMHTPGAATVFALGFLASLLYLVYALQHRFGSLESAQIHYDWRRMVMAAAGAASITIAVTLLGTVDVVLVKHYFDAHDAGIYSAASLVGKILLYLVGFIPTILLPQAAERHARGTRTRSILAACILTTLVVSLVGLTIFHFLGIDLLHALVGRAFDGARALLVPYAGAMVCVALISALGTYGIATHRLAFSIPLILGALATLGVIALRHPSLAAVVDTLLLGSGVTVLVMALTLLLQGLSSQRSVASP